MYPAPRWRGSRRRGGSSIRTPVAGAAAGPTARAGALPLHRPGAADPRLARRHAQHRQAVQLSVEGRRRRPVHGEVELHPRRTGCRRSTGRSSPRAGTWWSRRILAEGAARRRGTRRSRARPPTSPLRPRVGCRGCRWARRRATWSGPSRARSCSASTRHRPTRCSSCARCTRRGSRVPTLARVHQHVPAVPRGGTRRARWSVRPPAGSGDAAGGAAASARRHAGRADAGTGHAGRGLGRRAGCVVLLADQVFPRDFLAGVAPDREPRAIGHDRHHVGLLPDPHFAPHRALELGDHDGDSVPRAATAMRGRFRRRHDRVPRLRLAAVRRGAACMRQLAARRRAPTSRWRCLPGAPCCAPPVSAAEFAGDQADRAGREPSYASAPPGRVASVPGGSRCGSSPCLVSCGCTPDGVSGS